MDASDLSVALRTNLQIISLPYASYEWLVRNVSFKQAVQFYLNPCGSYILIGFHPLLSAGLQYACILPEREHWIQSKKGLDIHLNSSVDEVQMERHSEYYLTNLVAPLFVVLLARFFVVFLPADSGHRIDLSVTVLLSFTFGQTIIASLLPKTDQIPLLALCGMGVSALACVRVCQRALRPRHPVSAVNASRMGQSEGASLARSCPTQSDAALRLSLTIPVMRSLRSHVSHDVRACRHSNVSNK